MSVDGLPIPEDLAVNWDSGRSEIPSIEQTTT